MTCVEKLHANETREQCYDLRQKQVIRATGLSNQYTDTFRDSHDATRHKSRRTLAYSFQQFHLPIPFAIRYAGFVLSSFTVRPDGRTPFQYLLGTPYVSLVCMFGESLFALIPDHEVRTDGSVVAGGDELHRLMNTWWGRSMVCFKCRSVRRKPPGEQWSRRETVEARGTKWNFDVEMNSGISGPPVTSRPDGEMPTATAPMEIPRCLHLHLRQKNTHMKFEVTATAEETMWRPRRRW